MSGACYHSPAIADGVAAFVLVQFQRQDKTELLEGECTPQQSQCVAVVPMTRRAMVATGTSCFTSVPCALFAPLLKPSANRSTYPAHADINRREPVSTINASLYLCMCSLSSSLSDLFHFTPLLFYVLAIHVLAIHALAICSSFPIQLSRDASPHRAWPTMESNLQ